VSDTETSGTERKVEYYNRECAGGCGTVMEDLSWRRYCNDCLNRRLNEGYIGE